MKTYQMTKGAEYSDANNKVLIYDGESLVWKMLYRFKVKGTDDIELLTGAECVALKPIEPPKVIIASVERWTFVIALMILFASCSTTSYHRQPARNGTFVTCHTANPIFR